MIVNICGIPHTVIEVEDSFDSDMHLGQIDYKRAEIRINKDASSAIKEETVSHEMLHGILVHIGREDLSEDETFVTALSNAIYQGFVVIDISKIGDDEWRCGSCGELDYSVAYLTNPPQYKCKRYGHLVHMTDKCKEKV